MVLDIFARLDQVDIETIALQILAKGIYAIV